MAKHANQVQTSNESSSSLPKVYLSYTQDELDKAYTQARMGPQHEGCARPSVGS